MLTSREIAAAFSGHRFAETYDQLDDDVVWILPGQAALVGRSAVVAACQESLESLGQTQVEVLRFVVIADEAAAAVDSVTRYTDPDDGVTVVSSSDVYEFDGSRLVAITTYAVELDPTDLGPTAFVGA